jgi:hypothetical protein
MNGVITPAACGSPAARATRPRTNGDWVVGLRSALARVKHELVAVLRGARAPTSIESLVKVRVT